MTTKIYNKQLIEEFHSYNYFGCLSTGQSEKQQQELKWAWIDKMENRGWILDESIIYHDPGFGLNEITDNYPNFEQAGQMALNDAVDFLAGAF